MGGSGGGFFYGRTDPDELARMVRDAEAQTHDEKFETEVGKIIASLLTQFNDRDRESIKVPLQSTHMLMV